MNKKKRNIFITGATGFLASNLLRILLNKEKGRIYVLIRAKDASSLSERKNSLIERLISKSEPKNLGSRIHAVKGDVSKAGLGLTEKDAALLGSTIDTIYHAAAICDLSCELAAARKVNVDGTENLLKLALDWQKNGYLKDVNYISTAYVAGDYNGTFYEKNTDVSQNFNNNYEKSKFEAEIVALNYRNKGLRVNIYRPSIITDTIPPATNVVPALLKMLEVLTLGVFEKIPADINTKINMIPVDAVSEAIYLISAAEDKVPNRNYHIVNPDPLKLGDLLVAAGSFFGFRTPMCIPSGKFNMLRMSPVRQKIIRPFIPYLNQRLSFDAHNAGTILKKYNFRIPPIGKESLIKTFRHYKAAGVISGREKHASKG